MDGAPQTRRPAFWAGAPTGTAPGNDDRAGLSGAAGCSKFNLLCTKPDWTSTGKQVGWRQSAIHAYDESRFANRLSRSARCRGLCWRRQFRFSNPHLANYMKNTIEQKQSGRLQPGVSGSGRFGRRNWSLLVAGAIGLLAAGSGQAQQVSYPLPFYEPFPSAVSASGLAYNGFAYANNEQLGAAVNEAIGGYAA